MMKIVSDEFDFYSLQMPLQENEKDILSKNGVTDLEPELVSYCHTGALIEQMDMVISVCTSVIHLSGALNKPSLVLLYQGADWRWFEDETTSTWYPNTQIIRQDESDSWATVIENAKSKLEVLKK